MKRRTYFFPEAQLKRLEKLSRKTGLAVADLIRRVVDAYLSDINRTRQR
jgi:predicted DNA-binding protein